MVKAELELYEEQCNGVTKKLQEATASLQKINDDQEAKQRCCKNYKPIGCQHLGVYLYRELVSLQEACAAKKKQLLKTEKDMESMTIKEDKLCKHLKNVRLQVEEAKSAMQAQQNR